MVAQPGVVHDDTEKSRSAECFVGRITRFEVSANTLFPFIDAKHHLRTRPTILQINVMHIPIEALQEIFLVVAFISPLPDRSMC